MSQNNDSCTLRDFEEMSRRLEEIPWEDPKKLALSVLLLEHEGEELKPSQAASTLDREIYNCFKADVPAILETNQYGFQLLDAMLVESDEAEEAKRIWGSHHPSVFPESEQTEEHASGAARKATRDIGW